MDHAGDVAYKLRRGFILHPWQRHDRISEQHGDRERQVFVVRTGDGGAFRVTVDDVGYEGLTEDETYYEDTPLTAFQRDHRLVGQ